MVGDHVFNILSKRSTFSHAHKVGNSGINANFVFPYICRVLHYLYLKMSVGKKDYLLRWQTSLVFLILNGMTKLKLAILRFLYCGEIMKNSIYKQKMVIFELFFSTFNRSRKMVERKEFLNNVVRLIMFMNNDQEFSLNVFTEFAELVNLLTKHICTLKRSGF